MNMPHKEFASWYASVDLGDAPDRLRARGTGVSLLIESIEYGHCEHLVDVFLGQLDAIDGSGGDLMRTAFTESDVAFPVGGNNAEMEVLAEMTLAIVMDDTEENQFAGCVAELVYASLAGGAREISSVTDLLNRARDAMRRQGRLCRARTHLPDQPKSFSPILKFDECFEGVDNLADVDQAIALMKKIATRTATAIGRVAKQARIERETLQDQIKVQDEELDLLWWASNGQSDTLGTFFSTIEPGARPLLAAVEAARRTQIPLSPSSMLGLMEKVGVSAEETLSIADVVNAADSNWLKSIDISEITVRTPLHLAIKLRLQSPESSAWSSHWSAVTKIEATTKRKELEIADLFYHERLVLNAYGDD